MKRPPSRQQLRQSVSGNVKPDIGNEELRAQIKTLQYEVDSLKHDREVADLRHEKELREAQVKAEEVFHKARVRVHCDLEFVMSPDMLCLVPTIGRRRAEDCSSPQIRSPR